MQIFNSKRICSNLDDDSYEVLYDEYVRNKPCFEKHVSFDRLSLLHDEDVPSPKHSNNHSKANDLESNPVSHGPIDIFNKLHQVSY